ncbi:MAG: stage 0 sporulation family protein [Clostridia bacterium]|nr:stage 0 sporulation family protein [Clostridia bacterium]MBQ4586389.1 stage 0 sporulation family protein [Clostridia bacterium]
MAKIIGVKFKNTGKVYYFDPKDIQFTKGDGVIVETARGVEFGRVGIENCEVDDSQIVQPLKPVIRKASKQDEERNIKNMERAVTAKRTAIELVEKHNLKMKLIEAEFTFDGSKVVFYFTAPSRIDFRELVKELASVFHIRIELRQVGIRDEAKLLGGIAPCGRECCCHGCMPDFKKVTIKMAKVQGLSLNPGKISGLCGRLMCCLEYENDYYAQAYKKMPKVGGQVVTPDGSGVVVSNNMLKFLVKVKIEKPDGALVYKDFALDEVKFSRAQNSDEEEKLSKEEQEELKGLEE